MSTLRVCWNKYAVHVEDWYAKNYRYRQGAVIDAKYINSALTFYGDQFSEEHVMWNANIMAGLVCEQAQRYGASQFAAETTRIYIENTAKSYIERCVSDTGGFAKEVICMSDNDCPDGYRCRGVGEDSECVKIPKIIKDPTTGGYTTITDCPRGRQYQAPLIGGCDPGYYRDKKWGRDLCICEEGPAAETLFDKLCEYLSGNLKMILIVIVVIVIGMVAIKIASKKVSVG